MVRPLALPLHLPLMALCWTVGIQLSSSFLIMYQKNSLRGVNWCTNLEFHVCFLHVTDSIPRFWTIVIRITLLQEYPHCTSKLAIHLILWKRNVLVKEPRSYLRHNRRKATWCLWTPFNNAKILQIMIEMYPAHHTHTLIFIWNKHTGTEVCLSLKILLYSDGF